ncbi:S9 family peptidase [Haloglycomyces albus]|uniref:S9 family peptidase n=1 Tax=Haloglycomyces albus TaxID=526067 RepID=UPI00046D398C|nr:S9 family peptidase [Haloglycomyces albus]
MADIQPPVAGRYDHERTFHDDTFNDVYYWLRDPENPEVLDYLKAENAYTEQETAHLDSLRDKIFHEIKGRIQETDLSVPTRHHGWWYYGRTEEGKQYARQCRLKAEGLVPPEIKPGQPIEGEEVILDGNVLAEGHDFFSMGAAEVSPDGNLLAYSVNFSGDERFTLHFKDLRTGEELSDAVPDTFYGGAWSSDGTAYFYTKVDHAWRPHQVWRHILGENDDTLIYQEDDERFRVGIGLTRSEKYLMLMSASSITSEIRYLPADDPTGEFRIFGDGRRDGVDVEIDHQGDRFLVLHNDNAKNFTLGWVPVDDTTDYHELVPHSDARRLLGVDAFAEFAVVSMRENGLSQLALMDKVGDLKLIEFDEPLYDVGLGDTPEYDTHHIRFGYTSMVTPMSIYDYNVRSGDKMLRKQTPVLGDFNPDDYRQHREWATAADGTLVPVSIVAHKDVEPDTTNPVLLMGYGSYEMSSDPYFSIPRLSLMDRGVVFAIAHIRGGGEMGRSWYDDGKLLQKKNTFTDFISVADHLVETGWADGNRIVARGGSAGGLLMGAVANMAGDKFTGILAQVPFVDALTTILDPSMPLTIPEWDEWGNPIESAEVYEYMKSYSPYENVSDSTYPDILAVTSLNDTRVGFHEPAKWVAQLRHTSPSSHVLLKTEMEAGHGGRSGRYDAWKEEAFHLAWVLDQLKATQ